ncbi:MAG: NADH-quinone oxidoreductase subunit L [Caldilineaceae bacterium]
MFNLAWLLFAFPAAGALINLLAGHRLTNKQIGYIGAGAVGASFLVTVGLWINMLGLEAEQRVVTVHLWDWLTIGELKVASALLLDPLSITMSLVVTGVGFLIHVYSISYMEHEERFQRFFIYLNFFIFAMLILVLSDSFLGMFVGWEGVGLASFLLIGFWFEQKDEMYGYYADCGKKAFLVNRVGDFGMIVAMMLIFWSFGSLTFAEVFEKVHLPETVAQVGGLTFNLICLALLLGATGKSAQIPLYVWLPDAMAGPTPVSALIHAATMVTAGIYMIARTGALWHNAAVASEAAAWIGVLTAFLAASIALVQTDLKKILAYSTVSQLGYMMLGVGVGAYGAATFHLVTHAFFKACLFLGAGSVMHGLHGELDIRKMGGLRHKMPTTFLTFAIASLCLAGFPLTSGYFSKDGILGAALEHNAALYIIGLVTALLTAFYSARSVFVPFFGKPRDEHLIEHAHESPELMTRPLQILAGLALLAALLNLPFLRSFEHWLTPAVGEIEKGNLTIEIFALTASALIAVFGILMARGKYERPERWVDTMIAPFKVFQPLAEHKWYVDEIYNLILVRPILWISDWFAAVFDKRLIDGLVNGVASVCMSLSDPVRKLQTGVVPQYVLTFLVGVILVVGFFIFRA